ncbi:acyltransferase family protein [Collinsella tanakaei]|uniref:acyltransferase family protein n=1 Tax=Collinsella tanakaei TaxID=626935 RepID=UPI00195D5F48|nr:acyltransferase family protein [Collinsella tanakaei]MBM6868240.1 acetyltransferase [Collinsella tanakaei]
MVFQHITSRAPHDSAERTDSPSKTTRAEAAGAPARPRSRYIPALDGIRTLAVEAVVVYHLQTAWMPGGLQGVTVFFVLSGFLITRLLLVEYTATGRIDLKGFWLRRIRRLLPAIVIVMLACAALCAVFNHVMLTKMRPDIVPSLLFFNNWWQILRNVSYFDALGDPSPLTHFWSLAIEAQFYLVWPLILIGAFHLGAKRRSLRRFALVAAAVSALAMALLYNPAVDPSRVYYGTDTRVFSLLLGAWLAFIPERAMRPQAIVGRYRRWRARRAQHAGATEASSMAAPQHRRGTWTCDLVGLVGLIGLALIMVFSNGYTAFQYQGGTVLTSVFALMLIAACVQRDTLLARVFSATPLVWLGKRSYSIYLWHYPLLLLMNPASHISAKPWWIYVVQVAIVVAVAALSYRFVEEPCRRGAIGRALRSLRDRAITPCAFVRAHAVYLVAGCALIAAAGIGIAAVPDASAISEEGAALLEEGGQTGSGNTATPPAPAKGDETNGEYPAGSYDIVMIGDSVSVRTVPAFQERFPHGYIDALKNRQFSAGIDIYRDLIDRNLAGNILVFALGTNGPMSDGQIDELMSLAGDKRTVVFMNTRSPRPWVGPTNETLARAAERYDNVRVVDWYGFSEGKDELFEGDGTHLNDEGARTYIDLVYDAVSDVLPIHLDDEKTKQMIDDQVNAIQQALAGPIDELAKSEFSGRALKAKDEA